MKINLSTVLALPKSSENKRRMGWIGILMGLSYSLCEIEEYLDREESCFVSGETLRRLKEKEMYNIRQFRKEIPQDWQDERSGDKWLKLGKLRRNNRKGRNKLTVDAIARAREYPLTELVKADKNGMAHSPFRKDKHPSFCIRNNFYYDFATGESGDVIDFIMRQDGLSFPEAVRFLGGE